MNKITGICVFILFTVVFLIIQMLTYGSLDSRAIFPHFKIMKLQNAKQQSRLHKQQEHSIFREIVGDFLRICKKIEFETVLIDEKILKHLTERVEKFSIEGKVLKDGHGKCHYFCSQNIIRFGMFGSALRKKGAWDQLSNTLGENDFKSQLFTGPDERRIALENVAGNEKIPAHVVITKNGLTLHLVIFHERHGAHWSPMCLSMKTRKFATHLIGIRKSRFCKHQNIIQRFAKTTTAMDKLKVTIPHFPKAFIKDIQNSRFIPCDLTRARKFYSTYGMDQSAEADVFRLKARNLLSTTKKVLDELGVRFWLSSGTCLGWFRQCDFIPHSKDVDIGIWIKDYEPEISQKLQNAGLIPKHIFGKVEDSFELSFRTPSNDLKLDIFFFYEESDHMWNGGTQAKSGKKFKYRFPKFSLCWTEFAEMLVRVPCETLDYVMANYGYSWPVLMKEWDWKKSPSNVEENGEWPKNELDHVVQVFA